MVTAPYSGDANFQASQSASSQIVVSAAGTQSGLTTQAVRNGAAAIVSVNLVSQVLVVLAGGGMPGVSSRSSARPTRSRRSALTGGRATVNLKQNQAVEQVVHRAVQR